jgi:hypothetical protein
MYSMVARIRRFAREDAGTVMAETVIVLPALLWAFLALFVYWDSFRSLNTVQKAAYTISDIISREMKSRPPAYFDGLRTVMDFMLDADQTVKMRVTSITYSEEDDEFQVHWSYSPGGDMLALTTATLQDLKEKIPAMADADSATILETEVPYVPAFNIGLDDMTYKQFIVTRPRFRSPTCIDGQPCNQT